MTYVPQINRRAFVVNAAVFGGGLVLGTDFPLRSNVVRAAESVQHYDFSNDPLISERLNNLHAKTQAFAAKLRPARNKLISHADRAAISAGLALGAATDQEWNQFWLDLEDFIWIVHWKVIGSSFRLNAVGGLSDAGDLLKTLRHGSQALAQVAARVSQA
jgi:hypothetical protein